MADGAPRSFVASMAGLITGFAALISAGVAAYNIYKRDVATPVKEPVEVALQSFEAQPLQVAPGEALVLRWRSENADACSLEPGVGAVGVNGSRSVKPGEDTTYTVRCHGSAGEAERSVSVSVVALADLPKRDRNTGPVTQKTPRIVPESPTPALPRSSGDFDRNQRSRDLNDVAQQLDAKLERQQQILDRLEKEQGAFDDGGDSEPATADLAYHCCDFNGMRRCELVAPVLIGSGCFCPYQGTGISCP